jgi:tetratricopeptide (TPR) repeat protein
MTTAEKQLPDSPAPTTPPPSRRRRPALSRWFDSHYNDVAVVIIALVTVLTGLAAFLQNWASNRYASDIRHSQTLAMDALGQDMSSRQREGYDFYLYTTWNEWDWRRIRAKDYDPALAERSSQIADMIVPLTPLLNAPYYNPDTGYSNLSDYHAAVNLVTTTMLLEERTFTVARANVWNGKADGYVTVLTLLAVSLFLYGLSTTIKGGMRFMFAIVGVFLVGAAVLWMVQLTFSPVPVVPQEAIVQYARGEGFYWGGHTDEAKAAYNAALQAYPEYGSAWKAQAGLYLDAGEYADAAKDYEQAIAYGQDDIGTYWDLGWTYYLAGDYQASLEASRQALDMDPNLFPVRMNVATALLASGQTETAMQEYEQGLLIAASPSTAMPASWSHLYLRETVNDLERLIHTLDGQTGFYQSPDLRNVADRTTLRAAAERARKRIKEGIVALETTGSPQVQPTGATLSSLSFARYAGRRGDLLGQADTFPRGLLSVVVAVPYENLSPGAVLSRRVMRLDLDGVLEHLPTMGADITWNGAASGTLHDELESPWPGNRGLLPGTYTVEYYVNGNLLQAGSFDIPDEDTPIVGPLVFALDTGNSGLAYGPDSIFPAGVSQVRGQFTYSGLESGTKVLGQWYRNGLPYSQDSSIRNGWGSENFSISDVPPGEYRLELSIEGQDQVLQAAGFQVVDVASYLQAIGREPDDALFHRGLGDAYAYSGDYAEAEAHYARSTEFDPQCTECYHQWWSALYDQGKYQEAAEKLQQSIDLNPKEYTYLTDLGKTYYRAGDEESAKAAFRKAIPANPAYVYNVWGNALYSQERYQEALAKYQQAAELRPDEAVYYANQGDAYDELGQYDQAAAAYEQATMVNPSYASAYNKWGNMLYAQEDYAGAADKYQLAIEQDPSNAVYHTNLGMAYDNLGQSDLAATEYEQAVTLDPGYDSAWNRWGNILYSQGDYAGAAEKYQQAVALQPTEAVYHANLADAYYQQDEYALAAAEYEQATTLDPTYDYAWNRWGNSLYAQGDYAGAAEKYQQAVTLIPDDAVYHANLAGAYYQQSEYTLAAAEYEQAVTLDPTYDYAWNRWGNSLYAQGDYAGAAQKYLQALALVPDKAVYHYNLGMAYYQQGYNAEAIAEFQQAVALAVEEGDEGLRQNAEEMLAKLGQ